MRGQLDVIDQFALSLDSSLIPNLGNDWDTIKEIAKEIGVEVDKESTISLINLSIKYQAYIRYKYADAMLIEKNKR